MWWSSKSSRDEVVRALEKLSQMYRIVKQSRVSNFYRIFDKSDQQSNMCVSSHKHLPALGRMLEIVYSHQRFKEAYRG